jgi:hypothetical protein
MNFSLSSILAGLLFGGWGLVLLKKGKSEGHIPHILIGLTLMIYPYFFENDFLLWGAGVGLITLSYLLRNY